MDIEDIPGVQAVFREPETVPQVLSDGTVTGVEGAPSDTIKPPAPVASADAALREALDRFDAREAGLVYWQKGSGHRDRLRKDLRETRGADYATNIDARVTAIVQETVRDFIHDAYLRDRLEAAIRDTAALDVERLARAFMAYEQRHDVFPRKDTTTPSDTDRFKAEHVAAEYARLSETKP